VVEREGFRSRPNPNPNPDRRPGFVAITGSHGPARPVTVRTLAQATARPRSRYLALTLPAGQTASRSKHDGTVCREPARPEAQLNVPGTHTGDQAARVPGRTGALANNRGG